VKTNCKLHPLPLTTPPISLLSSCPLPSACPTYFYVLLYDVVKL
jgi:hypothetical protein